VTARRNNRFKLASIALAAAIALLVAGAVGELWVRATVDARRGTM